MRSSLLKVSMFSLATVAVIGMNGCSKSSESSDPQAETPIVQSGTAIDGILVGSTVCIDTNSNGLCSDEKAEDTAITDNAGQFSITSLSKGSLLLLGGTDSGTGLPFTGSLKAPAGSTVVTPLTSAIQALIENGKTADQAQTAIQNALGLTGVDLTKFDPLKEITSSDASTAAKAQKVLAKQAQLQTIVHAASATVAGAAGTDTTNTIASNMDDIFNEIVKNFDGATGEVELTPAKVSAATKAVAAEVYKENQAALIAVRATADSSASNAVTTANVTKKAIDDATFADATLQFNAAVTQANTTLQSKVEADSKATEIAAKALTQEQRDALTAAQTLRETEEAKIITAEAAQAKADADLVVAEAAAATTTDKAVYEAYLAAKVTAEKAAKEKALAQAAAAQAKLDAALLEASVAPDAAAKATAEAAAAKTIAEAAIAEASAKLTVAEAAADAAKATETLEAAKAAVLAVEEAAAAEIARLEAERIAAEKAEADRLAAIEAARLAAAIEVSINAIQTSFTAAQTALTAANTSKTQALEYATSAQTIADKYLTAASLATTAKTQSDNATAAATAAQTAFTALSNAKTAALTAQTDKNESAAAAQVAIAQAAANSVAAEAQKATTAMVAAQTAYQEALAIKLAEEKKLIDAGQVKNYVNTLLVPTNVANVADAKNMFTQLRETAVTFVDLDNPEDNSSTILGGQIDLLKTKIEPATKNITTDFENSATAAQNSLDAFGTSLETNFKPVVDAIIQRIDDLSVQTENFTYDQAWSVSANGDTLSHTFAKDSVTGIETEVITFNGQSITMVYTPKANGDVMPTAMSTSGEIAFSGEGYSLHLTTLSLANKKAILKANGTIDGKNSAKMTLSSFDLTSDLDTMIDNINMVQNLKVTFDGTILSDARTLHGTLALNEGTASIMEGSYTGLTGEPSFNAKVTLNGSLNSFLDDVAQYNNASWISSSDALVMVKFADKHESFVTSYTGQFVTYDPMQNANEYKFTLTTQSGETAVCNVTRRSDYYQYENRVNCENGVVLNTYYTNDGKVTALIGGVEKVVENAWTQYSFNGVQSEYTQILSFYNEGTTYHAQNGDLALNGEKITITALSLTPSKNLFDRTFDFKFEGTMIDGAKKIAATLGLNNGTTTKIYAQNIELTDGTSFVKADEFNAVLPNAYFVAEANDLSKNEQNPMGSLFENYTVVYEHNDNQNELDAQQIISAAIDNLKVSISDVDKNALTLDADVSYDVTNNITTAVFDGKYNYKTTTFSGHIDVKGNNASNENEITGTANAYGSVASNGFKPFSLITNLVVTPNQGIDGYTLFSRDAAYEVGIHLTHGYNATTEIDTIDVEIGDSKGVLGNYHMLYRASDGADNRPIFNVTNKDGASLATYGEGANGNEWEIKYSDNSSETLF